MKLLLALWIFLPAPAFADECAAIFASLPKGAYSIRNSEELAAFNTLDSAGLEALTNRQSAHWLAQLQNHQLPAAERAAIVRNWAREQEIFPGLIAHTKSVLREVEEERAFDQTLKALLAKQEELRLAQRARAMASPEYDGPGLGHRLTPGFVKQGRVRQADRAITRLQDELFLLEQKAIEEERAQSAQLLELQRLGRALQANEWVRTSLLLNIDSGLPRHQRIPDLDRILGPNWEGSFSRPASVQAAINRIVRQREAFERRPSLAAFGIDLDRYLAQNLSPGVVKQLTDFGPELSEQLRHLNLENALAKARAWRQSLENQLQSEVTRPLERQKITAFLDRAQTEALAQHRDAWIALQTRGGTAALVETAASSRQLRPGQSIKISDLFVDFRAREHTGHRHLDQLMEWRTTPSPSTQAGINGVKVTSEGLRLLVAFNPHSQAFVHLPKNGSPPVFLPAHHWDQISDSGRLALGSLRTSQADEHTYFVGRSRDWQRAPITLQEIPEVSEHARFSADERFLVDPQAQENSRSVVRILPLQQGEGQPRVIEPFAGGWVFNRHPEIQYHAFSGNGRHLILRDNSARFSVVNLETGQVTRPPLKLDSYLESHAHPRINHSGTHAIIETRHSQKNLLWDVAKNTTADAQERIGLGELWGVHFSPDGHSLYGQTTQGQFFEYSLTQQSVVRRFDLPEMGLGQYQLSPDGRTLLVHKRGMEHGSPRTTLVIDLESRRTIGQVENTTTDYSRTDDWHFLPDGRLLRSDGRQIQHYETR